MEFNTKSHHATRHKSNHTRNQKLSLGAADRFGVDVGWLGLGRSARALNVNISGRVGWRIEGDYLAVKRQRQLGGQPPRRAPEKGGAGPWFMRDSLPPTVTAKSRC